MAIDFELTTAQQRLRRIAREFACDILAPRIAEADRDPDPQAAFRHIKGAYAEAYKLGFATAFIPRDYGGGGASNLDLQIVSEEICAVDPGFATILLVNGLALMPLVWFGSESQKRQWLTAATSDPRGEYLAGWTVSEAAGAPGGTANYDTPAPFPAGIALRAELDARNGEYVLNGGKYWPANAGGWDLQGANVNVCIVRTGDRRPGDSGLTALIVPRGTAGVSYDPPIAKLGHRICQNNAMTFSNCRIPQENAFAIGAGDQVIARAFTWSAPVAAIASVGVARAAYEYVLDWARRYTAGGPEPIIAHQAVGYALAEIAMKIEACRAFSWKAAHYLDRHETQGHAICAMAKVFCGETLFDAVFKAMKVMGVNALDHRHPLERYLREAAVFPLYDAGNMGMQMRKIWSVMRHDDFDPRAMMELRATPFDGLTG